MSTLKCLGRGAFLRLKRWSHKLVFRFMYNVWRQWRAEIRQSGALHSLSLESLLLSQLIDCASLSVSVFKDPWYHLIPSLEAVLIVIEHHSGEFECFGISLPDLTLTLTLAQGFWTLLLPGPKRLLLCVCGTWPHEGHIYWCAHYFTECSLGSVRWGPTSNRTWAFAIVRFSSALMFICLCSFFWPFMFSLIGKLVLFGVPFLCMTYVFLCPGIKGAEW